MPKKDLDDWSREQLLDWSTLLNDLSRVTENCDSQKCEEALDWSRALYEISKHEGLDAAISLRGTSPDTVIDVISSLLFLAAAKKTAAGTSFLHNLLPPGFRPYNFPTRLSFDLPATLNSPYTSLFFPVLIRVTAQLRLSAISTFRELRLLNSESAPTPGVDVTPRIVEDDVCDVFNSALDMSCREHSDPGSSLTLSAVKELLIDISGVINSELSPSSAHVAESAILTLLVPFLATLTPPGSMDQWQVFLGSSLEGLLLTKVYSKEVIQHLTAFQKELIYGTGDDMFCDANHADLGCAFAAIVTGPFCALVFDVIRRALFCVAQSTEEEQIADCSLSNVTSILENSVLAPIRHALRSCSNDLAMEDADLVDAVKLLESNKNNIILKSLRLSGDEAQTVILPGPAIVFPNKQCSFALADAFNCAVAVDIVNLFLRFKDFRVLSLDGVYKLLVLRRSNADLGNLERLAKEISKGVGMSAERLCAIMDTVEHLVLAASGAVPGDAMLEQRFWATGCGSAITLGILPSGGYKGTPNATPASQNGNILEDADVDIQYCSWRLLQAFLSGLIYLCNILASFVSIVCEECATVAAQDAEIAALEPQRDEAECFSELPPLNGFAWAKLEATVEMTLFAATSGARICRGKLDGLLQTCAKMGIVQPLPQIKEFVVAFARLEQIVLPNIREHVACSSRILREAEKFDST